VLGALGLLAGLLAGLLREANGFGSFSFQEGRDGREVHSDGEQERHDDDELDLALEIRVGLAVQVSSVQTAHQRHHQHDHVDATERGSDGQAGENRHVDLRRGVDLGDDQGHHDDVGNRDDADGLVESGEPPAQQGEARVRRDNRRQQAVMR
jgi:hypothetical protein